MIDTIFYFPSSKQEYEENKDNISPRTISFIPPSDGDNAGTIRKNGIQYGNCSVDGETVKALTGNVIDGTNVLTQEMINMSNVRYIINRNLNLQGETITIPFGCILQFEGGSIQNGTIVGQDTQIIAPNQAIFGSITISGTWNVPNITSSWFLDASGDNGLKNVFALQDENVLNKIVIEEGDYPVSVHSNNEAALECLSNLDLYILGNIKLQANSFDRYKIINCDNASNINISGSGHIEGDKYIHTGSTGEHGMGIGIYTSKFVTIKDILIKDCWGDCIYVGGGNTDPGNHPENIVIDNVKLDNSRRQGITVVNGVNVSITNCRITNIRGTNPQAAIDIEPNEGQSVSNIYICNIYVENCEKGIIINKSSSYVKEAIVIDNCNIKCTIFGISIMGVDTSVTVSNNRIETEYCAIACNTMDGKQDNVILFINNMIYQKSVPEDEIYTTRPGAIYTTRGNYEFSHNIIECVLPAFTIASGTKRIIENDITCPTLFYDNASNNVSVVGNNITGNITIPGSNSFIDRNRINGTIESTIGREADDIRSHITNNIIIDTTEGGSFFVSKHELYVMNNRFVNIKFDIQGGVFNNNIVEYTSDFTLGGILIDLGSSDFTGNKVTYDGTIINNPDTDTPYNMYIVRARNCANNVITSTQPLQFVFYTADSERSNVVGNVLQLAEGQTVNHIVRPGYTGYVQPVYKNIGSTAERPEFTQNESYYIGCTYFDTTIGKPVYWNGTNWIDATGQIDGSASVQNN